MNCSHTPVCWQWYSVLVLLLVVDASCRDVPVSDRALVQKIACVYWVGHYAKRIFETYFVHT
jgi:hypothetical protein